MCPTSRQPSSAFCCARGGRGVIESIQEGLSLSSKDCQASYDTLYPLWQHLGRIHLVR